MDNPFITITIDRIKGATLNSNMPIEQQYLVLNGACANLLVQLLSTKEAKRILSPVG